MKAISFIWHHRTATTLHNPTPWITFFAVQSNSILKLLISWLLLKNLPWTPLLMIQRQLVKTQKMRKCECVTLLRRSRWRGKVSDHMLGQKLRFPHSIIVSFNPTFLTKAVFSVAIFVEIKLWNNLTVFFAY